MIATKNLVVDGLDLAAKNLEDHRDGREVERDGDAVLEAEGRGDAVADVADCALRTDRRREEARTLVVRGVKRQAERGTRALGTRVIEMERRADGIVHRLFPCLECCVG